MLTIKSKNIPIPRPRNNRLPESVETADIVRVAQEEEIGIAAHASRISNVDYGLMSTANDQSYIPGLEVGIHVRTWRRGEPFGYSWVGWRKATELTKAVPVVLIMSS